MDGSPTPAANWYPDPHDAAQLRYWDGTVWTDHVASPHGSAHIRSADANRPQPADPNRVLGLCLLYGLLIGATTGAASGTVAAPVIGTIIGTIVGTMVALPVALIAAAVISRSVASPAYRRRVDVTLLTLGVATAVLAVGWISLRALVGPWPALTMLVVVVVGLLLVRPRLHRLVPRVDGFERTDPVRDGVTDDG